MCSHCVSSPMYITLLASLTPPNSDTIDGAAWPIIVMQEGECTGRGWGIWERGLRASLPLFRHVDVQEIRFEGVDGIDYNHLPDDLRAIFPSGVLIGNTVGYIHEPRIEQVDGSLAIVATLVILDEKVRRLFLAYQEAGRLDRLNFSMNGTATSEHLVDIITPDGRRIKEVTQIDILESVDIVTIPGLDGRVRQELLASAKLSPRHSPQGQPPMRTYLKDYLTKHQIPFQDGAASTILASLNIEALDEAHRPLLASVKLLHDAQQSAQADRLLAAAMTDEDDEKKKTSLSGDQPPEDKTPPPPPPKTDNDDNKDEEDEDEKKSTSLNASAGMTPQELAEARRVNRETAVMLAMQKHAADMPQSTRTLIASRLNAYPVLTYDQAVTEIQSYRKLLASVSPDSGKAKSAGGGLSLGLDSLDKYQGALDGLFGLTASSGDKIDPFRSLRRAYIACTGDEHVDGRFALRASAFTSTTFSDALSNTLNRRLQKDYEGKLKLWEPFTYVLPGGFGDFRTQEEVQIGGIGELSTVTDDGVYQDVTVSTDTKESWNPFTKGNVLPITRRMIINDDLSIVDRMIKALTRAAHYTLQKFAFQLLIGWDSAINDQTMSDTKTVYHADHGNLQATMLSHAAIQTLNDLINAQTELDSDIPLDLEGKYLIVPKELKETAIVAVRSEQKPGTFDNDVNILEASQIQVIVIDKSYLGNNANNYYMVADPKEYPGITLGFFQGRNTPELIAQDVPGVGQVFTQDRLTWKIRFEFGGVVNDYRPLAAGIIA